MTDPRLLQDSDGNLVPADQITGPRGSTRQAREYAAEPAAAEGEPHTRYAAQCLAAEANFAMPATSPTTWLKGTQVLNARTLLLNARDCERQTTVHPGASPEDYHTLRFPI